MTGTLTTEIERERMKYLILHRIPCRVPNPGVDSCFGSLLPKSALKPREESAAPFD